MANTKIEVENNAVLVIESELNKQNSTDNKSETGFGKLRRKIHWLDYFLCSMWIFFMLFIGIGISGGVGAASKYIDSIAGIGRLHSIEFIKESSEKARLAIFGDVKAQAVIATTALQIAQISFDRITQVAIVAFVRALLTTVLNFLKTLLNKLKEARNQIAKLFNISGQANNLFKILNGRYNLCQKAESFVNGLFRVGQKKFETPLDFAFSSDRSGRSLSSLLTNPSEFMFGSSKVIDYAFSNISLNAQSLTTQQKQDAQIKRDQDYLNQNLSKINSNASGCTFSLSNTKDNSQTANANQSPADAIKRSLNAMVDSCSVKSCFETTEQLNILGATTSIVTNAAPVNAPLKEYPNSEIGTSLTVFQDFQRVYNPSKEIDYNLKEAEIRNIVATSADEAKKAEPKIASTGAIAISKFSDVNGDKSGSIKHADTKALCGTIDANPGSVTAKGKSLITQSGAQVGTSEQSLASQLSGDTFSNVNNRTVCPAGVDGISLDTEVATQAQTAIQQSSAGSGGGGNLADAVISLLNTFLQSVANLLIDTLFSFVNAITSSFCSNFAIDAICDPLTTTSKTWEANLRKDASDVRINSTKYSSYYEYYSGDQKLIGENEKEVDGVKFNNNALK